MAEVVIELNDGREVELKECWNCCDGVNDCGSYIDVYDTETNEVIASYHGTLPDIEDEDFDMDKWVDEVSYIVENY